MLRSAERPEEVAAARTTCGGRYGGSPMRFGRGQPGGRAGSLIVGIHTRGRRAGPAACTPWSAELTEDASALALLVATPRRRSAPRYNGDCTSRRADEPKTPIGDLDISFYRDDVGRQGPRARSRSSTPRTSTSTSPAAPSSSSTMCCSPAAPCAPRSTPSSTTAGRSACSSPCSATAATASCRSRPDYVGKNLPTARSERVNVRLEETDEVDRVTISEPVEVAA